MTRNWTSRSTLILVGVVLVLLNIVGINLFVRFDMTDDKVYSLSDASISLVESLDDPVTFKAFFTEDLPAPWSSNYRFLKDKLEDYRAYGGQQVQYTFVDPGSDEELQAEASRYNIPPVQVQVVENDNIQIKNAFMGLAIQYEDKREVIPVVQDMSKLEYDITSALLKLTRAATPTVGFLSGHGELQLAQDMPSFQQALSRDYDVSSVTLTGGVLSSQPDVLVVVAPADSLADEDLMALDAYVQQGGKVGFLLNRVDTDLQQGFGMEKSTGLEAFLARYGMILSPDLVLDAQSSPIAVQRVFGGIPVRQMIDYPFLPIATNFNAENVMVNRLREVRFFFVSTVDTSVVMPEGVSVEPLIWSSAQSGKQTGFFMLQPNPQMPTPSGGPFILAAAYQGTFPSAYEVAQKSVPTRMVLVGDGDLLNETTTGGPVASNIQFGLNMVDWLAQDEALLAIRSKSIAPRALNEVSDAMRPLIKYINILGPALLIAIFGMVRWRIRKAQRQMFSR